MEDLSVGGNPISQLQDKIVEHKSKFTWAFLVMAVVIIILVVIIIWLAATHSTSSSSKTASTSTTQGFNNSYNQVDFSGLTGNTSTNESTYDKFAERLVPKGMSQGFDPDPRNSIQKTFDKNFEGGSF